MEALCTTFKIVMKRVKVGPLLHFTYLMWNSQFLGPQNQIRMCGGTKRIPNNQKSHLHEAYISHVIERWPENQLLSGFYVVATSFSLAPSRISSAPCSTRSLSARITFKDRIPLGCKSWCSPLCHRTSPTPPDQQSRWMCSAPKILFRTVEQSPVHELWCPLHLPVQAQQNRAYLNMYCAVCKLQYR